jgi:hypothetical protein
MNHDEKIKTAIDNYNAAGDELNATVRHINQLQKQLELVNEKMKKYRDEIIRQINNNHGGREIHYKGQCYSVQAFDYQSGSTVPVLRIGKSNIVVLTEEKKNGRDKA